MVGKQDMRKVNLYKLFGLMFILMMVVSSNIVAGNLLTWQSTNDISDSQSAVYGNNRFLSSPEPQVSALSQSQDMWTQDALSGIMQSDGSVEVVIGVGSEPTSYASLSSIVSQNGGKITDTISMGTTKAIVVKIQSSTAATLANQVSDSGLARYVEPNGLRQVDSMPNDPSWDMQWGPQKIGADYAWNTTTGDSSLLVAVIDTGIDYTHPDLAANYVPLGYDFVNNDTDPIDDFGHGTHCAGIIAATLNNAVGIAGIAQVQIMAEKGLNSTGWGWDDNLARCIINATDAGAKILSNSWGSDEYSSMLYDAVEYATEQGVLVFASAGNNATDEPRYPAAFGDVIAVAATNSNDSIAYFSNYGYWIDVAAPGSLIYSTMPTYHVTLNDMGCSMNYTSMSGTSMACPHAAAVAALIWSQYPSMRAQYVRQQLESTSDDLGDPGFDVHYGYGRINAQRAVEQAPPTHDVIAIYWYVPDFFVSGSKAAVYVEVFNNGISDESNVTVTLLANGTQVGSGSITSIAQLEYDSAELTWTPAEAGTYNLTFYVTPLSGETLTEDNALSQNVTVDVRISEANFTQVASDPDEGDGVGLKAGYTEQVNGITYFKVDFYRPYSSLDDFDSAIMIDADRNPNTGFPGNGYYPGQNSNLGIDFMVIAGAEGPVVWQYDSSRFFDEEILSSVTYFDAPIDSSYFIIGVNITALKTNPNFDLVFCDAPSDWDWMPNEGYVPFIANNNPHELAVTLYGRENFASRGRAPQAMTLTAPETKNLRAKVFNFGQNDETGINFQLLINGVIVNSTTLPSLARGTSAEVTYAWTPNVEGHYNVTAYAVPVTGETETANNIESRSMSVSEKIALISDSGELQYITPLLDSMGINYDLYSNYDRYTDDLTLYAENITLLQSYTTVIFYNDGRDITSTEQATLNAYLAAGGNLLVTGFDSLYDNPGLADVIRSSSYGDNMGEPDLYVVNATHPIMNGPYGQFPAGFHISDLMGDNDAVEADTARGAQTIAELEDGHDKIIVTENLPGKVIFWNGDGIDDWNYNANCTQMLKNMLLWLVDTTPPVTTDDYNGQWHTSNFTINLAAQDYFGVNQTYYKINGGATQTVGVNGQPIITTESATNTLEYWSIDIEGNVESHHMLTQIKLDKTAPIANAGVGQTVFQGNSPSCDGRASTDNLGIVSYVWDFGDGSQGTGALIFHTYQNVGTYTAKLTVQDAAGNTATANVSHTIQSSQATSTLSSPTPSPTPTPTPTPTPSPTPSPSTLPVTIVANSTTIELPISGNITASQISNATITVDQDAGKTTISFNITGESGTTGFGNVTIPKSTVPSGTTPTIYIDNQICPDQGFTEDADNYYVWYITHFSTHQVSIEFIENPPNQEFPTVPIGVVIAVIAAVLVAMLVLRNRRKPKTQK